MSTNIMDTVEANLAAPMEKLMEDLRLVVENAEELLLATANQSGESAESARTRIQETMKAAKRHLQSAEKVVVRQTRHAVKATDEYVHDNPWKMIGLSACAGVIIGMLVAKR